MNIAISPTTAKAARLRESAGINQHRLARLAGFNHVSVLRWERGTHHPSIYSLETYLEALGYRLEIVPIETRVKESVQ